jgi:hypothetical protein
VTRATPNVARVASPTTRRPVVSLAARARSVARFSTTNSRLGAVSSPPAASRRGWTRSERAPAASGARSRSTLLASSAALDRSTSVRIAAALQSPCDSSNSSWPIVSAGVVASISK